MHRIVAVLGFLSLASLAAPSASTTNETPTLRADQAPPPLAPDPTSVDGDDMEIGEVSRVVKLADLARPAAATSKRTGAVGKITGPVGKITGPVGRVTGNFAKVNATGAVPLIDAVDAVPGAQYVDVADAGHMVAGDQNDTFTAAVLTFLSEVRTGTTRR